MAKRAIGQAAAPLRVYVNWTLDALGFTGRASGIWLVCIAVESTAILASSAKVDSLFCSSSILPFCSHILAGCGAPRLSLVVRCPSPCVRPDPRCSQEPLDRSRPGVPRIASDRARLSVTVGASLIVTLLAEDLLSYAYRQFMIQRRVQANEDGLRRAVHEHGWPGPRREKRRGDGSHRILPGPIRTDGSLIWQV